ncbi:MAG TPA: hypothetical protein VE982_04075 [Gaiellaceae bacterium]|nr:hypothetical protein [Gaiellaceae bacterium]
MRLVRAEVLKIAKRRGTMIWCAILTVGAVLVAIVVLLALHAANPAHHGPAGGAQNFKNLMFVLTGLGGVAAILIGSAAGTQDVQAGVFRDLVVTGRPRTTLFAVRYPGAILTFLPLLAIGFALVTAASYLFAGSRPEPTGAEVGRFAAYAVAAMLVNIAIAIGLAAFASSRVVVGVLIAWNAIVAQLLASISALGGARRAIDVEAAEHFLPAHVDNSRVAMSLGTALIVLVAWIGVFLAAGRWWTQRRDA